MAQQPVVTVGRYQRVGRIVVWSIALAVLTAGCRTDNPSSSPATHEQRIISLVPAVTEMLFAIDAGNDVVGVSSFDEYPAEVATLPRVGALIDPDFERILTLRPTLVVVYESQTDLVARLERASIGMFSYRHSVGGGLSEITDTMRKLGGRTGHANAADSLADRIDQELDDVRARVAGRARPATALVFGREPGTLRGIYVSGGVGFLHDLLTTAGGDDVFADVKRENLQASVETMLTRAPEVILELRTAGSWSADQLRAEGDVWKRLASLPAVRNDRVHMLTDPSLSIPGPRIAAAARAFAAALHP